MKKTVLIALATLTLLGGLLLGAKMFQIKGSDTMVNLVQILAEEYMAKNPGTPIAVLGGGSGTGITGLINQTCDVASSSREWKPKEIDQAWEKGVTPKPFVEAVDGLSIVVNEKNPVEQLKVAQVGALYRGEIKSWQAVGGAKQAVSLYGRQSNSGTYVFMQEFVLGNKNYSTDMKEMIGSAQILEGILQTQMGIQIHSNPEYRMAVRLVQDGVIGKVKEVHTWSEKKWGDTEPMPTRVDPVPNGLDWDSWIGVAAARPFIG